MIQPTPEQEYVWSRRGVNLPDRPTDPVGSQKRLAEDALAAGRTIGPPSMFSRKTTPREEALFPGSTPNPEQLAERLNESPLGLALPDPGDIGSLAGMPFSWYKKNVLKGNPLTKGSKTPADYGNWILGMEDPGFKYSGMEAKKAADIWKSKAARPVTNKFSPIEPKAKNVLDLAQPSMDDMAQMIGALDPDERRRVLTGFKAARELLKNNSEDFNVFMPTSMDPYNILREDKLPVALSKQISPTTEELARSPFDAIRSTQQIPGTHRLANIWKIPETTPTIRPWGTGVNSPEFQKTTFLVGKGGVEDLSKIKLKYEGPNPYTDIAEPYFGDEKDILQDYKAGRISPEQFEYSMKAHLNESYNDFKYPRYAYHNAEDPTKLSTFISNPSGLEDAIEAGMKRGDYSTLEDWINKVKTTKQDVNIAAATDKFRNGSIDSDEFRSMVKNGMRSKGHNWIVVDGYDDVAVKEFGDVREAQAYAKANDGTYVVNPDDYINYILEPGNSPMGPGRGPQYNKDKPIPNPSGIPGLEGAYRSPADVPPPAKFGPGTVGAELPLKMAFNVDFGKDPLHKTAVGNLISKLELTGHADLDAKIKRMKEIVGMPEMSNELWEEFRKHGFEVSRDPRMPADFRKKWNQSSSAPGSSGNEQ
jgi:hypothetical protein